ncbi:MAG: hypothetical protein RR873_06485, partial [Christensenella sp.]
MKKTKVLVALVLAVLMVFSVASLGFAAGSDIGGGAQSGKAESTVTMALSASAPKSISATVPLTIPLAVKVDSGATGATPVSFVPTDCKIINNSMDLGTKKGIAIDVSNVSASLAPGASVWSLKDTPAAAYDLKLGMCGGTFADLSATLGGTSSIDTVAKGYENIPGGADRNLSVTASVGGTNAGYAGFVDGVAADIFKVQFTVVEH